MGRLWGRPALPPVYVLAGEFRVVRFSIMTVAARELQMGLTSDGLPKRLFDVRDYYAMARAGILHHDEKLELIEGTIIRKHAAPPAPRLFNVDEYYAMAEAGILGDDDQVELIEGEVVVMSPIGSRHAGCLNRLNELLVSAARGRVTVAPQNPLRLDDSSEPQPDIALLRWRSDGYASRHPGPQDTLLVLELADSSLDYDRGAKLGLYARNGVAEVWVVDLRADTVETYRSPGPDGYAESSTHSGSDVLAVPGLDLEIEASRIISGD